MSWIDDFNRGQMRAGTVLENPFAIGGEQAGQNFGRGGGGGGGGGGGCGIILLPLIIGGMFAWPAAAVCSIVTFPVVWLGALLAGRRRGLWESYKTSTAALGFGLFALLASTVVIVAGVAFTKPRMMPTGPLPMTGWSATAHDWFRALAACELRAAEWIGHLAVGMPVGTLTPQVEVTEWQTALAVAMLAVAPIAAHAFGLSRSDPGAFGAGRTLPRYATAAANLCAALAVLPWVAAHLLKFIVAPH